MPKLPKVQVIEIGLGCRPDDDSMPIGAQKNVDIGTEPSILVFACKGTGTITSVVIKEEDGDEDFGPGTALGDAFVVPYKGRGPEQKSWPYYWEGNCCQAECEDAGGKAAGQGSWQAQPMSRFDPQLTNGGG